MWLSCLHKPNFNPMDLINRLREKPTATKKAIAFVTSGVVTLGILGLWLTVFNYNSNSSQATAAVAKSENIDVNPLSAFWNVISNGWDGIAKSVNKETSGDTTASTSDETDSFVISSTSSDSFILQK